MALTAFNPDSSAGEIPDRGRELSKPHGNIPTDRSRALSDLLQNKVLTHRVGVQGEWEVRTTLIASRQAWRYRSSVLTHGKETGDVFPPIVLDKTPQMRPAEAVSDEMLAAFAREAVEVHFARCASVSEYCLMASIYSQPLSRYRRTKRLALILMSAVALIGVYWLWGWYKGAAPEQPHGQPPSYSVRWQPLQVSYDAPPGEPFEFPLPSLIRMPQGMPVVVTFEASGDELGWLQLDRDSIRIRGTAPSTAAGRTFRLIVGAHGEHGSASQLIVSLTITGQPEQMTPTPQLRGHWAW
jgi:hypothetical protein